MLAELIRAATEADLPAILEIYNWAVLNTTATADYEPANLDSRRAWFADRASKNFPILVAEQETHIVGWASLGPYLPRYGYRFSSENSVYVAPDAQGKGIGKSLLRATCEEADKMGMRVIIAKIDATNEASIRLHKQFEFKEAGYFKELIFKFDRWLDVVHMQRTVNG
jgi:phosphinothricin acetyltransferase